MIRAGARPRNIVRKLLNKRTAANFDILLTQLARALDIDTGTIKHIYTIYARPVSYYIVSYDMNLLWYPNPIWGRPAIAKGRHSYRGRHS